MTNISKKLHELNVSFFITMYVDVYYTYHRAGNHNHDGRKICADYWNLR